MNKEIIIAKLSEDNREKIAEAITEIKQEGDLSIVPDLLDLLLNTRNAYLISSLTTLLSDIKDPAFKAPLMEKLLSSRSHPGLNQLLRICWESPLDFSEHFEFFIGLLIEAPFTTAIEASTILENLTGRQTTDSIQKSISRLQAAEISDEKSILIEDVILYLERLLLDEEE